MAWVYQPWTSQQCITFQASLVNAAGTVAPYSLVVLAGDGAPTIKGGWPKIQVIDRPRRVGFTMPVGYDPLTMDVPIQFDTTVPTMPDYVGNREYIGGQQNFNCEYHIQILEWMAGRGKVKSNGIPAAQGSPPLVHAASWINTGGASRQSDLIPRNVQGTVWYISNIDYDENPLRNYWGSRIQQKATVTLSQYIQIPGMDAGVTKALANKKAFVTFNICQGYETVAKVVQRCTGSNDVQVYNTVMQTCRAHGVNVTAYNAPLPMGTPIFIPTYLTVV